MSFFNTFDCFGFCDKNTPTDNTSNTEGEEMKLVTPARDFTDAGRMQKTEVEQIAGAPDAEPKTTKKQSVAEAFAIQVKQDRAALAYNVYSDKKRVAIIFNQSVFNDPTYTDRNGTEKDVQRLTNLLETKLNCIVITYNDKTKTQIFESVIETRVTQKSVINESDSIMVFILTHGEKENKLMARDRDYDLFELISKFTPENMEALAAKPKLFFVQACRGGKIDHGVKLIERQSGALRDAVDHHGKEETYSHPVYADLFVAFSSHHEHFSFRNSDGSWFIQEFCNTVEKLYDSDKLHQTDLYDIMTMTNSSVAARESVDQPGGEFNEKKQVSAFYSTLIRKVYLK